MMKTGTFYNSQQTESDIWRGLYLEERGIYINYNDEYVNVWKGSIDGRVDILSYNRATGKVHIDLCDMTLADLKGIVESL